MPDGLRNPTDLRPGIDATLTAAAEARAVWRGLGRTGVLSALVPSPEQGETDPVFLDTLLTELDRHLPLGVTLSVCVQAATVLPLLHETAAVSPLAADVLTRTVRGEAIVALAVTDSAAPGSSLLDARTKVDTGENGILVSGGKNWITNATHADYALVLAKHRPQRHFTSFGWVLVPADAAGVTRAPAAGTLFAGSGTGHLRFDDVRLPASHRIGVPGRGMAGFARQIGMERLASALWARALCRRVLADTRGFLTARTVEDRPLWDNAAIRDRYARCLLELQRLDALCRTQLAAGMPSGVEGMVLKAACAETVERVLAACVQLRGADAFRDGGEAQLQAEAAMFGIAGGAAGAMFAGIADHAEELLESGR